MKINWNNNREAALLYAAIVLAIIYFLVLLAWFSGSSTVTNTDTLRNLVVKGLEDAYYEGQRDALNGDIRIEVLPSGEYVPIKSAWNDTTIINTAEYGE